MNEGMAAQMVSKDFLANALVLLIEDDDSIAAMIEAFFKRTVLAIETAESLSAARRKLGYAVPNLIILDRMLPDGEGADFCAELRKDARLARVPVLCLSVRSSYDDRLYALSAGADDFLAKPFNPEELLVRANVLLRGIGGGRA